MKNIKVILILLLALSLVLSGCNMIEVNEEKDRETIVAKVGDELITKGEVMDQVDSVVNMYIMYGYYPEDFATNPEYADDYNDQIKGTLDVMVEAEVERQTAVAKGCYDFTAEEREELDTQIHDLLNTYINMYAQQLVNEPEFAEMSEDQLGAYAFENLDTFFEEGNYGFTTQDVYYDYENAKAKEKLRDLLTSTITVTEDEVKAEYASKVDAVKTGYEESTAIFEQDASGTEPLYFVPDNVRQAQHILISFSEEDADEIMNLRRPGEDEEADAKREEALKSIQAKADEAYQRAVSGEDFKALMEELGEDPGMESNEYYVVQNPSYYYVSEFSDGLFALENVGDISEPIASDFGYHIIKYFGEVESGPISYDEVRDDLYDEMLSSKQDEQYSSLMDTWMENAEIKMYYNRILD